MRRRLLTSTSLIALAAVVVLGLPLAIVGTELVHQRADMRLERRADAAALRLARAEARGRHLTFALVADLLPRGTALRVTVDGRRLTLGRLPTGRRARVTSGDGGPLSVALVAPGSARDDQVTLVWLLVAGAAAAALLAAAALAWVQAGRLAAPLEQLARRVERVGRPDYDDRPVAGHLGEIDQVQRALNEADERIAALVRREREFTANASHQLRTPLTALRMRLEELHDIARTPADAEEADAATSQVDRLVTTIEHLEEFARHRDDEPEPVDLSSLVADHLLVTAWSARYAAAGRVVAASGDPGRPALVHPESARQILDVLLDNALVHGRGATHVTLGARDGWVAVRVADEGSVAVHDPGRIFARGEGSGRGIGLAVARELARRDGGELRLASTRPTTFEALLRAASSTRPSPALAESFPIV